MAIALIDHVGTGLGVSGGTTGAINTTGANLLIAGFAFTEALGGSIGITDFTDSKGNTWTAFLKRSDGVPDATCQLFQCLNPTSVGSSHVVSLHATGPSQQTYAAAFFAAFGGASFFISQNGSGGTSNTAATSGGLTPVGPSQLFIAGLTMGAPTTNVAIDSSFTILDTVLGDGATFNGGSLAYKIKGSSDSTAENPQWTWTSSVHQANALLTFFPLAVVSDPRLDGYTVFRQA